MVRARRDAEDVRPKPALCRDRIVMLAKDGLDHFRRFRESTP